MSAPYSKRRFLNDLLFVGGVIAISAGLAAFGMGAFAAPEPPPVVVVSASESPTPAYPVAGGTPSVPPQQMNPAGAPPPPRQHITSGKVAPSHPSQRPSQPYRMSGDSAPPSTR